MKYTVSLGSNPRLWILIAIAALVAATAIAVFLAFGPVAGVVGLLVALYIDYQLVKFLRLQLSSYIEISEDNTTCMTSSGDLIVFDWSSVTHAGLCSTKSGRTTIFLYNEDDDQLITIPDTFSKLELLTKDMSSHVTLAPHTLAANETVRDYLRKLLNVESGTEDESPSEND